LSWEQALAVALITYVVTKGVDLVAYRLSEQREFRKKRRDIALQDIQDLKDEIGGLYALAANWKGFDSKALHYQKAFEQDHALVGRLHKYGQDVAQAGRDTLHWCMLVAEDERANAHERQETKNELAEKHREFLAACDRYLDNLV